MHLQLESTNALRGIFYLCIKIFSYIVVSFILTEEFEQSGSSFLFAKVFISLAGNLTPMSEYQEMSFLGHLEELRWHLVRICIAIVVAGCLCAYKINFIVDEVIFGMLKPDFITFKLLNKLTSELGIGNFFTIDKDAINVINYNIYGQINALFWISFVGGFILASPYIFFEIWRFIQPALTPKERKYSTVFISISIFLFMCGVFFGYFMIAPFSLQMLKTFTLSDENLIKNQFTMNDVISNITTTSLSMGLVFLMPLISYFLTNLGIITPKFLTSHRKHAFVVIMIITAFISNDIMSNFIIITPLWLLFEGSVLVSKIVYRGKSQSTFQNEIQPQGRT